MHKYKTSFTLLLLIIACSNTANAIAIIHTNASNQITAITGVSINDSTWDVTLNSIGSRPLYSQQFTIDASIALLDLFNNDLLLSQYDLDPSLAIGCSLFSQLACGWQTYWKSTFTPPSTSEVGFTEFQNKPGDTANEYQERLFSYSGPTGLVQWTVLEWNESTTTPPSVPIPGALIFMFSGIVGLFGFSRRNTTH